jgi:putative toxin-antitoxin system antitoxin component (TIGR02293 family)
MAHHQTAPLAPVPISIDPRETADLLGGQRVLKANVTSEVQAHRLVLEGIPSAAMAGLAAAFDRIAVDQILRALGVSQRSFARRKASPRSRLPSDESGRLWQFAGILAQAKRVFGSIEEAEEWLQRSAPALGGERPIDLVRTPPGAQLVSQYLTRIEYGVYT